MTKARGAADSIGKAGRGASFLLPAFSPYYVPRVLSVVPALARTRHAPSNTRTHAHTHTHTCCTPAFSFLSVVPLISGDLSSYPSRRALRAVLFLPLLVPSSSSIWTSVLYIRVHVHMCASSQSSYEVSCRAALRSTPAARGRLCTWVNGKMSFETFLGRSRSSPLSVIHTRDLAPCRSRENARLATMEPRRTASYYISDAKRMYCRFQDSNIVASLTRLITIYL